ncbi:hypothetical protein ACLB2K_072163 [Fragaria x ananassa]
MKAQHRPKETHHQHLRLYYQFYPTNECEGSISTEGSLRRTISSPNKGVEEVRHRAEEAHHRVEEAHDRVKDVKGYMTTSAKQQQQCSKTPHFKKRRADVYDQ